MEASMASWFSVRDAYTAYLWRMDDTLQPCARQHTAALCDNSPGKNSVRPQRGPCGKQREYAEALVVT